MGDTSDDEPLGRRSERLKALRIEESKAAKAAGKLKGGKREAKVKNKGKAKGKAQGKAKGKAKGKARHERRGPVLEGFQPWKHSEVPTELKARAKGKSKRRGSTASASSQVPQGQQAPTSPTIQEYSGTEAKDAAAAAAVETVEVADSPPPMKKPAKATGIDDGDVGRQPTAQLAQQAVSERLTTVRISF